MFDAIVGRRPLGGVLGLGPLGLVLWAGVAGSSTTAVKYQPGAAAGLEPGGDAAGSELRDTSGPLAGPYLYVCNQDAATVSVIDQEAGRVTETVDLRALGFSPTAKPHHAVVEPDGSYWYVSLIGDNRVLKFDRDNRLVSQVEFERPGMLALHPSEDLLYVGRSMAAVNPPQRIGVIDRSAMTIDEIDVFFPRPHALAVGPAGRFVYTSSLAENRIGVLDTETGELELLTLEGPPHVFVHFAISPDGSRLVSTTELTGKLLVFDISDPPAISLERSIDVNAAPWHPAFTPDGHFVVFGNKNANTVTVVDAGAWTVAAVIEGEGLAEPHGAAVAPDGRYAYVSNRNTKGEYEAGATEEGAPHGTVAVIDLDSMKISRVIEVGAYAAGIGTISSR